MKPTQIVKRLQGHEPAVLGSEQFAKFAVLLPLIEKEGELHVLFEVRSHTLRRQPGDICFPGGKIDPSDQSAQGAAVRETVEELGIKAEEITDVYPIDYMVSPFGMIVYPFTGFIKERADISLNPQEVEEVFTVPLSFFLTTKPIIHEVNMHIEPKEDFPFELVAGGKNYEWRPLKMEEYFYQYEDKVIWGLTARVIAHFASLMTG
ncbi:NUDIX hydrolase [Sediminibacillus halophilus]|uniref:NUDIX domain-containing protein n=1 Tax=Sediminibacillus halophilus TaxID=482461 RepID=A0A1G9NJS8_9BACI|nr:CoA pyrophosphatase [Sediminibacillus halophilus]SDL86603.1 NUDIX domain-containing protein [Sediminibacillus halophilus]